tara:strand:- start:2089 stop:2313 length:225 start_codon:yes stop_codon:yes gene_type:complete
VVLKLSAPRKLRQGTYQDDLKWYKKWTQMNVPELQQASVMRPLSEPGDTRMNDQTGTLISQPELGGAWEIFFRQ